MEDKADVFCVHCRGEVVEKRLPSVSPLTAERLHQKCLEGAEQGHLTNQALDAFP